MNAPTLYLVCGLPGAGKTTRSREIVNTVRAVHLCPDDWILGLGVSLVDYEFRVKFQNCMLEHAKQLLRVGVSVVIEFGSWTRTERDVICAVGVAQGATVELHFMHAPLDELVKRVRNRGGAHAEVLASKVLLQDSAAFEHPTPEESAQYDRYVGPDAT